MTYLKNSLLLLCLASLLICCASYRSQRQESLLHFPELGSLVKLKGNFGYRTSEQIGIPDWSKVNVHAEELPFNKSSYENYAQHMERAGKINSVPYNDSLPYKPKYLRLQLLDKVRLTSILNTEAHKHLRKYIAADQDHKIV
ncbi:hypothetical protein GTQ34_15980, partial [Muricauda sp. JGD-17]